MKLRHKLVLGALVLLLIPVILVRFLQSLDHWLVQRQVAHLQQRVDAFAAGLSLLAGHWLDEDAQAILPRRLASTPLLDGYVSEWNIPAAGWRPLVGREPSDGGARFSLGRSRRLLWLVIETPPEVDVSARNAFPRYQITLTRHFVTARPKDPDAGCNEPCTPRAAASAASPIAADSPQQSVSVRSLMLSPEAPGKLLARTLKHKLQPSVQGFWLATAQQRRLEMRLPLAWIRATDNDWIELSIVVVRPSGARQHSGTLRLVRTNPVRRRIMAALPYRSGERWWLTNRTGTVLAVRGELEQRVTETHNPVLAWLVGVQPAVLVDRWRGATQITGPWLPKSAAEASGSVVAPGVDSGHIVVAAPVHPDAAATGYVVLESARGSSLLLSQPEVEHLINRSLLAITLAIILTLIMGSRVGWRISRLLGAMNRSMDPDGRVIAAFKYKATADEIGQLGRGFSELVRRLQGYQDYQERLASRLSHELRTPLSVVRGAIDNLQIAGREEHARLIARAGDGIERMAVLIRRMREAAGLEQSIAASTVSRLDMDELLQNISSGLNAVWPDVQIKYISPGRPVVTSVAADLIAQAVEKLVSNAVDFHTIGSEIELSTEMRAAELWVWVANSGPTLKDVNPNDLFGNMVSKRDRARSKQPHLGLGLHIVYLIARFHRGQVEIRNRAGKTGVCVGFSVCRQAATKPSSSAG